MSKHNLQAVGDKILVTIEKIDIDFDLSNFTKGVIVSVGDQVIKDGTNLAEGDVVFIEKNALIVPFTEKGYDVKDLHIIRKHNIVVVDKK